MTRVESSRAPSSNRRVYLVTPGGTRARGGIGRLVAYLSRAWDHPDYTLCVLDSYGPGPRALMPFYFAGTMARLVVDISRGRTDVIHVNMSERLSVLRKGLVVELGAAFDIPVILHLHGAEFVDYCRSLSSARRARVTRMMLKANRILVLGTFWRSFVVDELKIPADRVSVLHNAVPGPSAVPSRPAEGTCRLLFLGVVGVRKGIETLLQALPLLPARTSWHLDVAGNGNIEACRAEVSRLGVADRVTVMGWVDERRAARLLAESDVLVLPSRNEGLPLAILEGMSYGLPIVTTPVGSIMDAVSHGETGLLVPPGDHVALAAALTSLVEDPDLRRKLGRGARDQYERTFQLSTFKAKLAGVFHRVLANGDAPQFQPVRLVSRRSSRKGAAAVGADAPKVVAESA